MAKIEIAKAKNKILEGEARDIMVRTMVAKEFGVEREDPTPSIQSVCDY